MLSRFHQHPLDLDTPRRFFETCPVGQDLKHLISTKEEFPRINVSETEDKIHVDAELSGFSKDQVKIDFNNGRLTLSGEKYVKSILY